MARQKLFADEPFAKEGMLLQLAARANHNVSDRIHEIVAPTLIVGGIFDGQASERGQLYMHRQIEGSTIKTIAGSHNLIFESDECYQSIIDFCTQSKTTKLNETVS